MIIFSVRVFNRVVRSNTVQTVEVGTDPSLARELGLLGRSSEEGEGEGGWSGEQREVLVRPHHTTQTHHRSRSPARQITL